MSRLMTKILAGILLALFLIRLLNTHIQIPSFLYYLIGMLFLLIISFTYWKEKKIGLGLLVLLLALLTGVVAILEAV